MNFLGFRGEVDPSCTLIRRKFLPLASLPLTMLVQEVVEESDWRERPSSIFRRVGDARDIRKFLGEKKDVSVFSIINSIERGASFIVQHFNLLLS